MIVDAQASATLTPPKMSGSSASVWPAIVLFTSDVTREARVRARRVLAPALDATAAHRDAPSKYASPYAHQPTTRPPDTASDGLQAWGRGSGRMPKFRRRRHNAENLTNGNSCRVKQDV